MMTRRTPRATARIVTTVAMMTLVLLVPVIAVPWGATTPEPAARTASTPPSGETPAVTAAAPAGNCPDRPPTQPGQAPVLAHYYMWFTANAWNRAKTDFPAIGRYSSDQRTVMDQQVEQARAAGIDGFIVGWRSTPDLNARLATLRDVAADNDFKLAITYQAQDFHRKPLPVEQVRHDLEELAATYADDPAFHLLGDRPVVALSGTWHYSEEQLRSITEPVASRLLVLATEKNVTGYQRVAAAVEGELYYWSSADPQQTSGYQEKLMSMAGVVRERCGIWVAPVAPGFDARLVGGRSVVERRDGKTLRTSWESAQATVPDVIGVISWNEFSENTHIEPSTNFGTRYLDVIRDLTGAPPLPAKGLDSSGPAGTGSILRVVLAFSALAGALVFVTVLGARRRGPRDRRGGRPDRRSSRPDRRSAG